MEVCTGFFKFTPPDISEVLAHLWVSEGAVQVGAHGGGSDVHDVLLSALIILFAEACLVKLADGFSCHFPFFF